MLLANSFITKVTLSLFFNTLFRNQPQKWEDRVVAVWNDDQDPKAFAIFQA